MMSLTNVSYDATRKDVPMSKTLLTIDDEAGVRQTIRLYFEDMGFRVFTAPDGDNGLAIFQQEKPDVVLADLRMPRMNGLEVVASIKKLSPDTPVIVVSGTGVLADAINAVRLGAWDYVTKPIDDMKVLGHIVNKALERSQLIRENKRYQQHLEEEVKKRTADLNATNERLRVEINEHIQAERKIKAHQEQLRVLANALSIAEEKTRKKVATFLHDDVSQNLVSCKLMLDTERQSQLPASLAETLDTVCEMMAQIALDTQDLTVDLASPTLYRLGLKSALTEWLRDQVEAKHGIRSEVKCEGTTDTLNDETQAFIFRAVKELGFNAIKHAQAQTLTVDLTVQEDIILVTVADDGIGFDVDQAGTRSDVGTGMGLFSIQERLDYMGGHFQIESGKGQGTRIVMRIPATIDTKV
jgi:signal transduction histidine kinase